MTKKAKLEMKPRFEMTRDQLAALGRGEVAYVRAVTPAQVRDLVGSSMELPDTNEYFCLYMADGTPISISDSRHGAVASAADHELTAISVH